MHPALSVIFFTTSAGAGYGMMMLLGVMGPAGLLPQSGLFGFFAMGLALLLVAGGLLSSTVHLGHPERAWRAMSQWRSSWLAREGVAAVLTFIPAGLYAIGWVFFGSTQGFWAVLGFLMGLLALVTVFATSMIYASLRTIQQWHTTLVPITYMLLGLTTGAVLVSLLAHLFGAPQVWLVDLVSFVFVIWAWAGKLAYWWYIDSHRHPATPASATGLTQRGEVTMVDPPHIMENYLLKEMGYKVARKHAHKLRRLCHLTLFAVPAVAMLVAMVDGGALGGVFAFVAVASAVVGIVVERWLFFAEAKHTVTLYYGEARV